MNLYFDVPASEIPVGSELALGPALVGWSTTVSILWGAVWLGRDQSEILSSPACHSSALSQEGPGTAGPGSLVQRVEPSTLFLVN